MNFADKYLEKQSLFPQYISTPVSENLGIIITIPCYDEPDLLSTLNSLWECKRTKCKTEVIVMLNSGELTPESALNQNKQTLLDAQDWISKHKDETLEFFIIHIDNLPKKTAGVGLARKIAMDEAVMRFNAINKSNGAIVGFDADSLCKENYMQEIEKLFLKYPKANGANLFYEHPLEGDEFSDEIYDAIAQYELYLRYYMLAMRKAGHIHAYHTVGSSFAVSALAYIKQGGMNRRQAGEDFYFLQKIIPQSNFHEIVSAGVIPSPRTSDRVPFGTGKAMSVFLDEKIKDYKVYNYAAFKDLSKLFYSIDSYFKVDKDTYINKLLVDLPGPVRSFLKEDDFYSSLEKINKNSATIESFRKKFFDAFNAFKVLKYLNNVHEQFMETENIVIVSKHLMDDLGVSTRGIFTAKEMLIFFREFEKQKSLAVRTL